MAGSHRATPSTQQPTGAKRLWAVLASVVAVAVLVGGIWLLNDRTSGTPDTPSSSPSAPSSSLPSSLPSDLPTTAETAPSAPVTQTFTAAPETTPPAPVVTAPPQPNLPKVAPAVPRRLLSKGLLDVGFDDSVEPVNGSFRAASTAEVARWGSRGKPGSPSTDTVYVIGKSFTKGVSAFDTLPRIKVGATIVIRTDNGDLTYTVRAAGSRTAAGLAQDPDFAAKAPGRLVVVGLGYDTSGTATGKAFVVTCEITGAIAK